MAFKKQAGRKDGRPAYYVDAVRINGFEEGTKGRVVYRVPKFSLAPASEEANSKAIALDQELQSFLAEYLKRARTEQAENTKAATQQRRSVDDELAEANAAASAAFDSMDDDIPF